MGERVIRVCDVCGKPAAETVVISRQRTKAKVEKDLCTSHLNEYETGGRRPRPGRKRAVIEPAIAPRRRGRPPKIAAVEQAA